MRRVVTAELMRRMDAAAIESHGVSGATLMDAAGLGVAEAIIDRFSDLEDARVVILAGKGNNGGDGSVAARYLKRADLHPVVVLIGCTADELTGDAAQAHRAWVDAGGESLEVTDEAAWKRTWLEVREADLVVDAMLGTGARGAPRGLVARAIESVEALAVPVIAVDIPSGLDADTGQVEGSCLHADLTVTLALPKRGLLLQPGRSFTGDLEWVDIGFPPEVESLAEPEPEAPTVWVTEPDDLPELLPDRDPSMHKGDRGRLLLVGGSPGLTGAMALAGEAAVRAGAGLVTAGVPLGLQDVLEAKLTEVMTLALPQLESRVLTTAAFDTVALFQPGRLTALAVGPGLGRHPSSLELARRLLAEIDLPTVVDADAIHAFAGQADRLRLGHPERLVVTPHAGEFAALTGESPGAVAEARIERAHHWARRLGITLVLKGAPTIIAGPDRVAINPTGSEALATGGTGDVLTGFIAGFLAQGVDPWEAAVLGVYLHGWAADCLVDDWASPYGLKAGDLIDILPLAIGWLLVPEEEPLP